MRSGGSSWVPHGHRGGCEPLCTRPPSAEPGVLLLIKRACGCSRPPATDTSDPLCVIMRQIAGSFAQYEKTRLVTKLRGARERVREAKGKCDGRKSYAERQPELVVARSACIVAPPRATADRSARAAVFGLSSVDLWVSLGALRMPKDRVST